LLGLCREREPRGLTLTQWRARAAYYLVTHHNNESWARERLMNIAFATIVKADYCGMDIRMLVRPPGLGVLRLLVEEIANRGMTLCECGCPTPVGYATCCLQCGDHLAELMPEPKVSWIRVMKATGAVFEDPWLMRRTLPPGAPW